MGQDWPVSVPLQTKKGVVEIRGASRGSQRDLDENIRPSRKCHDCARCQQMRRFTCKIKFVTGKDLEDDSGRTHRVLHLFHETENEIRSRSSTIERIEMGCGGDPLHPLRGKPARNVDTLLEVARPIVDGRQDVIVEIDHAGITMTLVYPSSQPTG